MRPARAGLPRRILKFILLAALGLILAVALPLAPLPYPFSADATGEVARAANPQELIRQGRDYYQAGEFQKAAGVLRQAAAAYQEQGNRVGQSRALSYLSLAYRQLGYWDEAETAIAASLQQLPAEEGTTPERRARALALNVQGSVQLTLGQAEAAFATWEKAAKDYEQLGDRQGSSGARLNQAQALEEMGRYRRSCSTLLQVLNLDSKTCDELEYDEKSELMEAIQKQNNSPLKAAALRSLGNVLRSVGQLDGSEELLKQSLAVAEDLDSPADESLSELYLGNTQRAQAKREGDFNEDDKAEDHRKAALEHYQKAEELAISPTTRLLAQLNRLSLLAESEDAESSERVKELLEPIASSIEELPASSITVKARINLAESLMGCDRLVRGIRETILKYNSDVDVEKLLENAVSSARGLENRRLQSAAIGTLGKWYEYLAGSPGQKKGDRSWWEKAEIKTSEALKLAEESDAADLAYQWQWQMGRLLRSVGNVEGAIANYTDAAENLRNLRSDLQGFDANVRFDFRDNVEPVYRGLVDLLLREADATADNILRARKLIDDLQLAELADFLQCAPSSLLQKEGDSDRDLQKAAVIYTIILPNRLEVILELPGQILKRYPPHFFSDPQEPEAILSKLRKSVVKPSRLSEAIAASQEVYGWLITPLESDLENSDIDTLVFVLDGQLRNIPMAVLYDKSAEQYLVQKKYALALLPNSDLFDLRFSPKQSRNILAAGISEELETLDGKKFRQLEAIVNEVRQIQERASAKVLLNSAMTRPSLSEEVNRGNFSVVHLATHGSFSSNPQETYVLVYGADGSTGELLRARDFDNLLRSDARGTSNPVELLVLSACTTAKGDNRAALGLAGLAVRAGVRSTIATLWQVSDKSTVKLMNRFYQELEREGVTKAEALHRAQKTLLEANLEANQESYQNPYYWAPYVLVGNWR